MRREQEQATRLPHIILPYLKVPLRSLLWWLHIIVPFFPMSFWFYSPFTTTPQLLSINMFPVSKGRIMGIGCLIALFLCLAGRIANKNPFNLWNAKKTWLVILDGIGLAGWHVRDVKELSMLGLLIPIWNQLKLGWLMCLQLLSRLLCSLLCRRGCCLWSNMCLLAIYR